MADSNIGSLPQAANLDDDSLLVAEQQGQAVKVTGAQFKEFGRQAVIGQVQGYVDQAEAAADRAVEAVSAVTDMTVEASTLPFGQSATVTKTTKNGKVNLAFGLPRGEQGVPGPEGQTGPRGPQGPTGKGLTILGHYDTETALRAAVTAPEVGDPYSVGAETPYDIYIFDGVILDWKNYGPLAGGGGVLPDDVVTAEGGASMSFPLDLGDGPHVITFTQEEEPPLTAEDIEYSEDQTVKDAIDGLKASVSNGKSLIASAITDKGVDTAQDATFQQMADNIEQISGGSDTSDATATSFDILAGKTAYTAAGKVEGVIPTLATQTITPGTADKTIASGQYLGGTQVIKGDPNLTSGNIKSGVTLFGVEGALESTFQATLTVTADIGAVVTATHSGGTKVEALSTTGTVVLELPLEGTWSVTAVRGVAQYNTVTIEVSSQYSAALTAEVHFEYFGAITGLAVPRERMAAAALVNYALFAGGYNHKDGVLWEDSSGVVDAYDRNLTHTQAESLSTPARLLASASLGNKALFAGGYSEHHDGNLAHVYVYADVNVYNQELVRTRAEGLGTARRSLAGASIGNKAIFAGGEIKPEKTVPEKVAVADAYDDNLSRTTPVPLPAPTANCGAASNDNYAIFSGEIMCAYDSSLTRSLPSELSVSRTYTSAARAGNYVLIAGGGGYDTVDAYDLFLTRTTPEVLSSGRSAIAGTTLNGFALFGGPGVTVDCYDPYLVRTSPQELQTRRSYCSAASVDGYALFGGGNGIEGKSINSVEAYRYV